MSDGRGINGREQEQANDLSTRLAETERRMEELTAQLEATGAECQRVSSFMDIAGFVVGLSSEGRLYFVNRRACEVLGASRDELLGSDWFLRVPEPQRDDVRRVFRKLVEAKGPLRSHHENTVIDGQGRERFYSWENTVLLDGDGNVEGVLAAGEDVTERHAMEEALRRSEAKYRVLFDSAPVGFAIADTAGRIVQANKAMCEITGHDEEALKRYDLASAFAEPQRALRFKQVLQKHGAVKNWEVRFRDRKGRIYDAILDIARIKVEGEDYYLIIERDITAEKQTEDALRESQRALSTLMSNLPGMAYRCLLDRLWTMEFVSEGSVELTGYRPDELVRNRVATFEGLIHPDDRSRVWEVVLEALSKERPFSVSYRLRTASGIEKNVWEQGRGVRGEDGEIIALEGFIMDISSLVRAEEERKNIQSQFLQAQKMEAVGTLAGGVAHDFNNLLTTIQGYTDLALMQCQTGGPVDRSLERIQTATTRAAALTRQLLMFSRKQPMEVRTVDLNRLLEDLMSMLNRLIGEDIHVDVRKQTNIWMIQGDQGSLEQVIMNLVVNARDAMPTGGHLTLTTENTFFETAPEHMVWAVGRRWVVLSVTDTGVGMTPEVKEHIFEPFFTTKEPGRGTGLGLSVVYGTVREHQGWVEVDSEPAKGSTFRVLLPAMGDDIEVEDEEREADRPRGDGIAALQGGGEHVLLVEDDDDVRRLVMATLLQHGYQVTSARSKAEAEARLEEGTFDLVFSDVVLVDGSGLDLVDRLRKDHPDQRVLMTSGYTDQKARLQTILERRLPFLQKPFNVHAVLAAVRKALGGKPGVP